MRKHLLTASATLAALLLVACGGAGTASSSSSGSSACTNASAAHHAYLVVTHLNGRSLERCVGFPGAEIAAEDLMKQSGVEYQTQEFSGLGKGICQVDREPAQFSECFPKGQPYWAMYIWSGSWQTAQTGLSKTELSDGQGLGLRYVPATASPAPTPPPVKK